MTKNTLEIFYDYICPFCYRGLREFFELLPDYPYIEIDLCPCEVNPEASFSASSSHRAIELAYYLKERGLNVKKFNDLVFEEHFENQGDISRPALLAGFAEKCGADPGEVASVLDRNSYSEKIREVNRLVWEELPIAAVPAYRLGDIVQGSAGGILISRAKLIELLELANSRRK